MKELHYWAHWFRQLAESIEAGGESFLVKKVREVDWGPNKPFLLTVGDKVDPLSFLYTLAQRAPQGIGKTVYDSVTHCFELDEPPDLSNPDVCIFPQPIPIAPAFFGTIGSLHKDLLWKIFRQTSAIRPNLDHSLFATCLKIPKVGMVKLTQTLFLVNPSFFVSSDILSSLFDDGKKESSVNNLSTFMHALERAKQIFLGCHGYEINWFCYLQYKSKRPLVTTGSRFFHIDSKQGKSDRWDDYEREYAVLANLTKDVSSRSTAPRRGDIILIRRGTSQGISIGIVNQDVKISGKDCRVHASWITNSEARLKPIDLTSSDESVLTLAKRGTYSRSVFRNSYPQLFELIDGFIEVVNPLNKILFGPPGTSKTWHTVTQAVAIAENRSLEDLRTEAEKDRDALKNRFDEYKASGRIAMVTFHQNTTYEDFIEGIRPELTTDNSDSGSGEIQYRVSKGIFRKISKQAEDDPKNRYVLIIDEINRGNIARIFGELITLIEDSKRIGELDEARVRLLVSKEEFGVPSNLHLVGTMNTADRSIALLDTALRRRFKFHEMMPDPNHPLISSDAGGVDCRLLLKSMNERIEVLLDREHQIGHTYFLNVNTLEHLKENFLSNILPLLQEYFYEDWGKIRAVLGGNGFIQRSDPPKELVASGLVDKSHSVFRVLPEKDGSWLDPKEYRSIYGPASSGGGTDGGN